MNSSVIAQVYEQNKMCDGKKIKFFKDAKEIKTNKFTGIMPPEEQVIFGIKQIMTFYVMTDKAFYYEYDDPNAEFSERFSNKRAALDEIKQWSMDSNSLTIDGDKITILPLSKQGEAFMSGVKNIFTAVLGDMKEAAEAPIADSVQDIKTSIDSDLVGQICRGCFTYDGNLKFMADENELSESVLSGIFEGESIAAVIKKGKVLSDKYIFTDKAFYFNILGSENKRVAYQDIPSCRLQLAKGKISVNRFNISLGKAFDKEQEQLLYSLYKALKLIIAFTTKYDSLPPLSFNESVTVSDKSLSKHFDNGISAHQSTKASAMCSSAFKDFDPALCEKSIAKVLDAGNETAKPDERTLFDYKGSGEGFYITDRHFVVSKQGSGKVSLLLTEIKELSLENRHGKVYLSVTERETHQIEIIRPCVNSCAYMLTALSMETGERGLGSIFNILEQFKRLGMINLSDNLLTSNDEISTNQRAATKAKFAVDLDKDRSFAFWMLEGIAVYLSSRSLTFSHFFSNRRGREMIENQPLSDTKISLFYRSEGGSKMTMTLGLGLGLLGAVLGSAIDSANQPKYFFDSCRLSVGKKYEHLSGMQLDEAVLLRFLIEACV